MKNHSNMASRIIGILGMAVAVGWLQPTAAYGQTAEGTVIANTATVTYTDANSNTYSSVNGSVNVTVGFGAGVDVVAAQAAATPVSPSTNNTMNFDLVNIGNGTDSMSVAESISDGSVLSVVKYTLNAADYFSLVDLNVALAGTAIAAAGTETITVTYDIASNKGGEPSTYTLTATSRRGAATDNDLTLVTPGLTGTVATTPNGQAVTQLPSNGTEYTFTFNVANNQNGVDDFDLLVTLSGSGVITIVSVNSIPGASTTITNLAAGANQNIDVVYRVATGAAAGATETLFLDATSVAPSAETDQGSIDLTVIKASLTITKEAWDDLRIAEISADVLPGDFIEYKVIIANTGTADATNVHVDDLLPPQVTYISAEGDVPADWSFTILLQDFDADLTPALVNGSPRVFWIRVQVN